MSSRKNAKTNGRHFISILFVKWLTVSHQPLLATTQMCYFWGGWNKHHLNWTDELYIGKLHCCMLVNEGMSTLYMLLSYRGQPCTLSQRATENNQEERVSQFFTCDKTFELKVKACENGSVYHQRHTQPPLLPIAYWKNLKEIYDLIFPNFTGDWNQAEPIYKTQWHWSWKIVLIINKNAIQWFANSFQPIFNSVHYKEDMSRSNWSLAKSHQTL